MHIILGRFQFAPRLGLSLLALVVFVILVRLGFWQLDRADEKKQLESAREAAGEVLRDLDDPATGRFTRVRVAGRWDAKQRFLLDNMVHQTQSGFHVLTPLLREGKSAVLVNLGWIPTTGRRDQVPSLAPLPDTTVRITGRLNRLPEPGIRLGPSDPPADGSWPRVVVFPNIQELEVQLGYPVYPLVVLLDPQGDEGYVREWQLMKFGPERHVGYAVQWFALALALLCIYLVVNTKRVKQ